MGSRDKRVVQVRNAWNGWQTAEVHIDDLQNIHWFHPAGAPHSMVHAYVLCTNVLLGHIPHDCTTTRAPHRVLVCVVKRSVPLCLYTELVGRADESGRGLTPQDAVHRFERWSLVLTGAGLLATAVVLGRRRKRLTARTSRDLANQLPPPRQHHILAA